MEDIHEHYNVKNILHLNFPAKKLTTSRSKIRNSSISLEIESWIFGQTKVVRNSVFNFDTYMFHSTWDISTSLWGQIGKKWSNVGKSALVRLSRIGSDAKIGLWAKIEKARRPTTTLLTTIFKCRVRTLEDAAPTFYTLGDNSDSFMITMLT